MRPSSPLSMAGLLRNVTNAIWHAFDALRQEEPGLVNKTKLKVLTANIATVLDLYGVEKGLDHYRSTTTLSFEYFKTYLYQEVFATLPNSLSTPELRNYEEKIEEICWLICRTNYTTANPLSLKDNEKYQLFRIFCLLSDFSGSCNPDVATCKVLLSSSEATLILQQITDALGFDSENDKRINDLNRSENVFSFREFLELLEFKDNKDSLEYEESLHEVVKEIYQTYIKDIIKKGYLMRKGYLLHTLKEYWFVLKPCEISYYKNQYEKDLCGTIRLDPKCMVKPSCPTSGRQEKFQRFVLSSGDQNFELATQDHRSRMQWISALQLAITYSMGREGYQRDLIARRRTRRQAELERKKDEESQVLLEVKKAMSELETEKMARLAAETQARELKVVALEDSRRVAELEDMKINLEKLLHEETQAKRDEEIVRALQARVLAEEWEKREELERLQKEQKALLEVERQKREAFEEKQAQKERELREAEQRLRQVEEDRKKLDRELKQARFKILRSEENKEDLEARIDSFCPMINLSAHGIQRSRSFVAPSRELPAAMLDLSLLKSRRAKQRCPQLLPAVQQQQQNGQNARELCNN